jgi:hypothetical protein
MELERNAAHPAHALTHIIDGIVKTRRAHPLLQQTFEIEIGGDGL